MTYDDYVYEYTHCPWNNWGIFDEEFTEVLEDMGYPYSEGFRCEYSESLACGRCDYVMIRAGEGPWTQNLLHMHSYEERSREYAWAIDTAAREYSMEYDEHSRINFDEYEDYPYTCDDEEDDGDDIPDDTCRHVSMRKGRHGRR